MDPGSLRVRDDIVVGQVGRWRLTPTPQARAIAAVSAPATRIAFARAMRGSVMSGVSALMAVRIGGEDGVWDRLSDQAAWHRPAYNFISDFIYPMRWIFLSISDAHCVII